MSLTLDLTPSRENRRGMIPTPAGALPKPRRPRRGHVDLAKWDAAVAADNAANGTQSISAPQGQPDTPAAPTDPDLVKTAATALPGAETGATAMSREAILEPDDTIPPKPEAPATDPAPVPAMTPVPEDFVPSPPPAKATKPQTPKPKK